jgi:hypothetical protein
MNLSMKPFVLAAVLATAAEAGNLRRWLSFDKLAGYSPGKDALWFSRRGSPS